jgi:diadenosine tetraphosphate (Ap4A) HIT family hydrolase
MGWSRRCWRVCDGKALAWWQRERRPGTMRLVPADQECVSCANNARADLPARERIYLGPRWRVAHAFGTSLPGWLVLVPRRHTVALDDLTADEAADLGPLLKAVSSALRDVVRCRKTYVALFAEAEGFQHIHFHIIPRQPGLEADLRGPRVFGLLGGDPASYVPEAVMVDIADRLSQALHLER